MNELVLPFVFIVMSALGSWFILTAPTKMPDEIGIGFADVLIALILAPIIAFVFLMASARRK